MTPGWWFDDELKRVAKAFDPASWSGDRREIEIAFGDLEIRLENEQRAERKVFVQGYDARATDQATGEILQRLRDNMNGLRPEQQWGSQEAMNQVRESVRRDLAVNPHYQQQRSEALSEFANDQAEQMKRLYDREAETLQASGFEPEIEQVRKQEHSEAIMRMGEILSETRQDIQRLDEIDGLTKAEGSLQEAKTAIDAEAQAKEERRKAFFASMDRTDQQEQELQKLRR